MSDDDAPEPSAPARARASVELGRRFAELLGEKYAHQLGVCGKLGIAYATYKRWMAEDEPKDAGVAAFREVVLEALEKRRVEDLEAGELALEDAHPAKASARFNMWKFQHESRFRRFYEPEAAKLEVTGKDGGPVELDMRSKSVEELIALALAADVVKRGRDEGDEDDGE